jgi:hypothetical protein
VLRKLLTTGLLAGLAAVPVSAQTPVTLMPGVTYENAVQFTPRGPVAMHIVRAPRPGGLYVVRPILSNEAILGRETLTAMQKRVSAQATVVSVNGDTAAADGQPTGMLMRDGLLDHAPLGARSSAGFDAAGTLHVDRVSFVGTWRGTGQRRPLNGIDQAPKAGEVSLFTAPWAGATPRAADAVDAVLTPFPAAAPGADLQGVVTQLVPGGGSLVPPGGAVLQARGTTVAQKLTAEAPVGTSLTARLILKPEWTGVAQALGGGPLLVKSGKAIFRSNEAFEPAQLLARTARAAVGQLADGRVLLVTVDGGRPGYSIGFSNFELALALQRLGAVWAMALAPDRDAALAFDGSLLSRPAGSEQPVADALSVMYYGVYAAPPAVPVFSPNGDAVGETQALSYKLVRRSMVRATLVGPDAVARVVDEGPREPGTYRFPFAATDATGAPLPEGAWRWTVSATDDTGASSTAERTFSYDLTLGSIGVVPALLQLSKKGAALTVTAQLTRAAELRLQIETPQGTLVATVTGRAQAGAAEVAWDGRLAGGAVAPSGRYVARLFATGAAGTSDLQVPFSIRRTGAN